MVKHVLEQEIETFERHRAELVGRARGDFVLIKGERIVGIFDSEIDAINRGYEEFGNVPFLVQQILEIDIPLQFTSLDFRH